jgi:hypothetical protein
LLPDFRTPEAAGAAQMMGLGDFAGLVAAVGCGAGSIWLFGAAVIRLVDRR